MSTSPAYHLRTNKAVERTLFVELLRKLDSKLQQPIENHWYVGMGGPYLEDFALVHGTFGNSRMTSLEIHEHVRSRQFLNQPYARIKLTLDSTGDFVGSYRTGNKPMIVWFDYEWQDWGTQLAESCDLLPKLPSMSVFRITLTGKTDWLGGEKQNDVLAARAERLTELFSDYGPFTAGDLNADNICSTLYRIARRAIADAVPDSPGKAVRTLAAYEYNDGTPVLTITMIVGPIDEIKNLIEQSGLKSWQFAVLNWRKPKEIDVPFLGLRERLAVDRLIPDANAKKIVKKLGLRLTDKYHSSVGAIDNYIEFYRQVPHFLRVTF